MNQPKVSVIIPVYNTEKYLHECLDSVVNQTLKDIEIICVDDGSTDSSPEILREYAAKDDRVKVYTQEKSNAGAARNVGLSKATGEYLAFLDSDDYYELFMLEHMLACAQERMVDIVVCRFKAYYENTGEIVRRDWSVKKKLLPPKTVFSFRDIKQDCFQCILGYNWDKLIKRLLVIKNQLSFQSQDVYNDSLFTYSALVSAQTITVLDEALVVHRHRSAKDSITDRRSIYLDCAYTYLKGLKTFLTYAGCYASYERDFINYVIHMFYVDLTSKVRDSVSKKELKKKISLWLDEFQANGYTSEYYYDLSEYEKLLQQIQIRTGHDFGITLPVIVSLTSYPARINNVYHVIEFMKNQTIRADKIILWLAEEEFPTGLESLPSELLSAMDDQFEIKWCHNLKPHNKYYDTMLENPESIVITVDDDIVYPDDLIEKLLCSYLRFPYAVSAMRAHLITFDQEGKIAPYNEWIWQNKKVGVPSYCLLATGVGGVLYPPHCMHSELFNMDAIESLCLNADDLWLKVMQILNGTPVVTVSKSAPLQYIEGTQENGLRNSNVTDNKNDEQLARILKKYDNYYGDKDTITQRIWLSALSFKDSKSSIVKQSDTSEADAIRASWSYRIGRSLTFAPRKLSSGVQCYRDHGTGYTVRRVLYHIGLWEDEEAPKSPENRPQLVKHVERILHPKKGK